MCIYHVKAHVFLYFWCIFAGWCSTAVFLCLKMKIFPKCCRKSEPCYHMMFVEYMDSKIANDFTTYDCHFSQERQVNEVHQITADVM